MYCFLDAIASLQEGSKSESGMIIKTSLQGHRIYNIFNMSGMVIENITMVRRSGMIIKLKKNGNVRNDY